MKDMDFIEKQSRSEQVFHGCLLHVYRDTVILPNGKESTREFIKHPGASVIIPYLGKRQILLIRQYRYPVRRVMIELPAGKIDGGEKAIQTIQRELIEETGYHSENIIQLGSIHTCVGYSDEVIYLFWAGYVTPGETKPDPDETIELFPQSIDAIMNMIWNGKITDAKTLIGLFWADRILNTPSFAESLGITTV